MPLEKALSGDLVDIVSIWTEEGAVFQTVKRIMSLWEEDDYLKTKSYLDIIPLWETDSKVKNRLDRIISDSLNVNTIQKEISRASLLKHAYLARKAAMKDKKEKDYSYIGKNYKFILPLK
ncbi:MAG: hypothetical protein ACOC5F_00590 [Candidatus Aminicenantaceae bacterium]